MDRNRPKIFKFHNSIFTSLLIFLNPGQYNEILGEMNKIYSSTPVCRPDDPSDCLHLEPGMFLIIIHHRRPKVFSTRGVICPNLSHNAKPTLHRLYTDSTPTKNRSISVLAIQGKILFSVYCRSGVGLGFGGIIPLKTRHPLLFEKLCGIFINKGSA